MSTKPAEIIICLGSSCFARGNKKTLQLIQEYIKENQLEELVNFRGNHCFGKCHSGPNLKINGTLYEGINENDITEILEKELSTIKK